jgi:hypothetical protein
VVVRSQKETRDLGTGDIEANRRTGGASGWPVLFPRHVLMETISMSREFEAFVRSAR